MQTELHRGRLIDHIQLVVSDLEASRRFYTAVTDVLGIPIGGEGNGFFWADELFASSSDSEAALGKTTLFSSIRTATTSRRSSTDRRDDRATAHRSGSMAKPETSA